MRLSDVADITENSPWRRVLCVSSTWSVFSSENIACKLEPLSTDDKRKIHERGWSPVQSMLIALHVANRDIITSCISTTHATFLSLIVTCHVPFCDAGNQRNNYKWPIINFITVSFTMGCTKLFTCENANVIFTVVHLGVLISIPISWA